MKNIILLLSLIAITASGRDWTYSTNLFWTITNPTNIFAGTNSTDPDRDSYIVIWNKINADVNLLWRTLQTSTNAPSVAVTNPITGAPGTSVMVTNLGTAVAAVFQFTIPRGDPGTNFVTVNQFTNVVLSSQRLLTYATNFAYWNPSNFLARVNGLYDWRIFGGDDGGNPPQAIPISLVGSFTGTNAWFVITNGFQTTNFISVAVITNGYSLGGGHLVNPGSAFLFSIDKWELLGRTNSFFGQHLKFDGPTDPNDAATKAYVDGSLANLTGYFTTSQDSNSVYHTLFSVAAQGVFDVPRTVVYAPIISTALDGTGTNFTMSTAFTNLTPGWSLQFNTNLLYLYNWTATTNFTTNVVSGVTTFTIPIDFSQTNGVFFRILKSAAIGFTMYPQFTVNQGIIYPSNTWSVASITNGMPNFAFWQGNSNGQALVSLYLSNGVVRIKQIAP